MDHYKRKVAFNGHSGAEADHSFKDGDELTASAAYGGKSGIVTATQGRSYVMLQHEDGTEGIYHFSDLAESEESLDLDADTERLSTTISDLGYGRSRAAKMCETLEAYPQIAEYVTNGVISTREELESVLYSAGVKPTVKPKQI